MSDPINLRHVRKAKKRAAHEVMGARNRAAFGQSKASKSLNKAQNILGATRLDGAKLDRVPPK